VDAYIACPRPVLEMFAMVMVRRGVAKNLVRWDKLGGLGDRSPQRGPGAEYGTVENRGRDKN